MPKAFVALFIVLSLLISFAHAEHAGKSISTARRVATKLSVRDFVKKTENEKAKDFFKKLEEVVPKLPNFPYIEYANTEELLAQLKTDKWKEPLENLLYKFINIVDPTKLEETLLKISGKTKDEDKAAFKEIITKIASKKQRLDKYYEKLADLLDITGTKEAKLKAIEELLRDVTKDQAKFYALSVNLKRFPKHIKDDFTQLIENIQKYDPIQDTEANKLNRKKLLICLKIANEEPVTSTPKDKELDDFRKKAENLMSDYVKKNDDFLQNNYLNAININEKGEIVVDAAKKEKLRSIFNTEYASESMGDHLKALIDDKSTTSTDKAKKILTYFVNTNSPEQHILYFVGKSAEGSQRIQATIKGKLTYEQILKAYQDANKQPGITEAFPVISLPDAEGKVTTINIIIK